jgi:hypothetical protein
MSFEDDSRALVPVPPPTRTSLFARFMARVAAYVPQQPQPPSVAPELHTRIDALADRLAAHEELTHKRLEESESRTLHLMQQRFTTLEREILTSLREEISREVEEKTASLRARIGVAVGVSLGAVVLAIWALVR